MPWQPGTNLLLSTTDPLGRVTRYSYDLQGNVTGITDPLTHTRTFTYDPTFNKVSSSTDPLGNVTTFEYDPQGNLTAITDPLTNTTTITHNGYGQPLTTTDPLGHTVTFTYDEHGNLLSSTDPLGNTTTRTYDSLSRQIARTDPLGRTTHFSYDPLDRLTRTVDPLGGTTFLGYDANGNLLTVTDARGNTTSHAYDTMNRLVTRTDPLTRGEHYTYDSSGNLQTVTDRKNQVTTHTYDGNNRRTRTDYADGSSLGFTYDGAGNLLTATDSLTGTITRSYDALNRLLSEVTPQGAISYAYDAANRRISMQTNGLPPVAYGYDAASRLTGLAQGPQTASLSYDPANRRSTLTLPNGITVEYVYDLGSRLTAQIYRNASGVLGDLQYTYDATGSRIATGGSWARTGLPDSISPTSYDTANQQLTFGPVTQTFDANGNLLTQTDPSGTTTYAWDARNRLVGINGPTVSATFAYDALGRRVSKSVNGVTTSFHYDGLDIVQEAGPPGDASYLRTLAIDEALARTDASGTSAYLSDILGSTLAVADAIPAIAATYTYEPFGRTEASGTPSPNPFRFTAREDDGTGLYYYRARYYDPVRNRFVSEDPIGLAGGDANLYAFVLGNPVTRRDPLGLVATDLREIWQAIMAVGPWNAYMAGQVDRRAAEVAADQSPLLGGHSGPQDAYRHCVWSCLMTQRMGPDRARMIGDIHEAANTRVENQPVSEDVMDTTNNAVGQQCGQQRNGKPCSERCMDAYKSCRLFGPGGIPLCTR